MADSSPPSGAGLTIPDDVRAKYQDLLELIKASESMNDEERQYWINILPIMTPEQIKNLFEILDNERKQLQAIDDKYSKDLQQTGVGPVSTVDEAGRRQKRTTRQQAEQSHKQQEDKAAEDLLRTIEGQ